MEQLVGKEVTAVYFVMDYVQLVLDDVTITYLAWPDLFVGSEHFKLEMARYEKEFRNLIGEVCLQATFASGEGLTLDFGPRRLRFNPLQEEISGPEVLHIVEGQLQSVAIWQVGESPFELSG